MLSTGLAANDRVLPRLAPVRGTNMTGRVAAAAAVVALLLLSACTDEPDDTPTAPTFAAPSTTALEPSPSESAEPSTAESTTPALAAPALPAAATEETPEGAAAFAEWWFETLNYARATGDTTKLRAAYVETCGTCENFASQIDETYSKGGLIEGGTIDVTVDTPTALEQDGVALAMQVSANAGRVLNRDGAVTTQLEAEQLASVMAVLFIDSSWVAGGIQ